MVAKSIDIQTQDLPPYEQGTHQLLLEWSPSHFHVLLINSQEQQVIAIESFQGLIADADDWQMVVGQSRLLGMQQTPAWLISAGPRVLPIPSGLYHSDRSRQEIELLMGEDGAQHLAADIVPDYSLVMAWQMPAELLQVLRQHFSLLTIRHLLGQLLQQPPAHALDGQLVAADETVLLLLRSDNQLLYAGAFPMLSHDDTVYRLLNICRQMEVDAQEVHWQLSGTIEMDSPLYTGFERFLKQLTFLPPAFSFPEEAHSHYFSHLLRAPL